MDSFFFAYKYVTIMKEVYNMSYLIINSLFIVVIFASALMGMFLIYLAYKIGKEQEQAENEMIEEERKSKYYDIFDQTNLKK